MVRERDVNSLTLQSERSRGLTPGRTSICIRTKCSIVPLEDDVLKLLGIKLSPFKLGVNPNNTIKFHAS